MATITLESESDRRITATKLCSVINLNTTPKQSHSTGTLDRQEMTSSHHWVGLLNKPDCYYLLSYFGRPPPPLYVVPPSLSFMVDRVIYWLISPHNYCQLVDTPLFHKELMLSEGKGSEVNSCMRQAFARMCPFPSVLLLTLNCVGDVLGVGCHMGSLTPPMQPTRR